MTANESDQLGRQIFADIMTAFGAVFAVFWHWSYHDVAVFLAALIVWELAIAWIGVKMRVRRERLTLRSRLGVH
jgi:hypothetical protein